MSWCSLPLFPKIRMRGSSDMLVLVFDSLHSTIRCLFHPCPVVYTHLWNLWMLKLLSLLAIFWGSGIVVILINVCVFFRNPKCGWNHERDKRVLEFLNIRTAFDKLLITHLLLEVRANQGPLVMKRSIWPWFSFFIGIFLSRSPESEGYCVSINHLKLRVDRSMSLLLLSD